MRAHAPMLIAGLGLLTLACSADDAKAARRDVEIESLYSVGQFQRFPYVDIMEVDADGQVCIRELAPDIDPEHWTLSTFEITEEEAQKVFGPLSKLDIKAVPDRYYDSSEGWEMRFALDADGVTHVWDFNVAPEPAIFAVVGNLSRLRREAAGRPNLGQRRPDVDHDQLFPLPAPRAERARRRASAEGG